jgi:hypothetical protein
MIITIRGNGYPEIIIFWITLLKDTGNDKKSIFIDFHIGDDDSNDPYGYHVRCHEWRCEGR